MRSVNKMIGISMIIHIYIYIHILLGEWGSQKWIMIYHVQCIR
jgi:hypothetical protein